MKLRNEVQKPVTSSPPLPALERNMKPNKTVQEVPPPVLHILTLTLNMKNLHILCFANFFHVMLFYNITCNQ